MLVDSITEINFRLSKRLHQRFSSAPQATAPAELYGVVENDYDAHLQATGGIQTDLCHYILPESSISSDPLLLKRKSSQLSERAPKSASTPWSVYAGPTASVGSMDSVHQQTGLSYYSAGALAGFDYAFSHAGLGFLIEYDHFHGDGAHKSGQVNINQFHTSLYGVFSPPTLPELSIQAILGRSYNYYTFHRNTGPASQPVKAKGSPDGYEYDALIGSEYVFTVHKTVSVAPMAYLQYVYEHTDGYHETRAGLFDFLVGSQHLSSFASFLGTRVVPHYYGTDWQLDVEVDILWQHEFLNPSHHMNFTSSIGPAGSISTTSLGSNLFLGGIDFFFIYKKLWNLELSYDVQVSGKSVNNSFYLGGGIQF